MLSTRLVDFRGNFGTAKQAVEFLWCRRELVLEMTRRDVVDRYAGQMLGSSWAVITPLLTMAIPFRLRLDFSKPHCSR